MGCSDRDMKKGNIFSKKVKAVPDTGNKTIFELKTESGRAINTTSNHPYLTKQGWVKVAELKSGDKISVPYLDKPSSFSKSDVENILILDCCLNASSFDQIGQSNFDANAKHGLSLVCGDNFLASNSNSLYDEEGMVLINFFNSPIINPTCLEDNLEYLTRSGIFPFNSSKTCDGKNNFRLKYLELSIINRTGFSLKNENNILVSTISSIHQPSLLCLFQTLSFNSLPNLKQSSSVNSEFSSILSNFLSNNALLTFSDKNLRIASDKLSSGNVLICFFNSSGIDKVKFGIFKPPQFSVYSVEDLWVFKPFDSESEVFFDEIVSIKVHAP